MSDSDATISPAYAVVDSSDATADNAKRGWKASVSLEFDLKPVLTWKGPVSAVSPATAMARAVREARKAFPRTQPRSWVCVLERI